MLMLVAGVALTFWLFRNGLFWGFLGLYFLKHVLIAYLCHAIGLNRRAAGSVVPSVVRSGDVMNPPTS